jgi:hypothetical protein
MGPRRERVQDLGGSLRGEVSGMYGLGADLDDNAIEEDVRRSGWA